ncbi:unnamed protein product [Blepharisma stoltei]|uniref:Ubiquitin-like domain-containing protein n=1 Tax=Blepharisma stoltei TaxID=1481888 RepID=A0AAU9IAI4_9CILI|nr:unnamed protein product [Blepharisma stoltei]
MVEAEREIRLSWLYCQDYSIKLGSDTKELKENIENATGIPIDLQIIQLDKATFEGENLYEAILQKQFSSLRVLSNDPEFIEYNNKNEGISFERDENNDLPVESMPSEESKEVELIIIVKKEKNMITINDSCTILDLKYEIEKKLKIAFGYQILFYKGIVLRNKQKIRTLELKNPIKLMKRLTGEKFDIDKVLNLKILNENPFTLMVPPTIAIEAVKTVIFNKKEIEQNSQSLYFEGRLLEDNEILKTIFQSSEPELALITRQIGCGVKKKQALAVDLRTKQKSSDRPNEYIKPVTRIFNIFIQCINKCEETKDIRFDEGLVIGREDFPLICRCGSPVNVDIVVHEACWKFFGIKNGNRIILNSRRSEGDNPTFILYENKQISDLSSFSEFRFEVKKSRASKS